MHARQRRLWLVAAAATLAAALAAALFWATRDEAREAPGAAAAAASARAGARVSNFPASASLPAASVASSAQPVMTDPVEAAKRSHEVFVRAVEEAAKRPPASTPPEIARAKTFPEAFEAMQALQRRVQEGAPSGTAAINPFAAAASAAASAPAR